MPARMRGNKLLMVRVDNSCEESHCKEKERNGAVARWGSRAREYLQQLY